MPISSSIQIKHWPNTCYKKVYSFICPLFVFRIFTYTPGLSLIGAVYITHNNDNNNNGVETKHAVISIDSYYPASSSLLCIYKIITIRMDNFTECGGRLWINLFWSWGYNLQRLPQALFKSEITFVERQLFSLPARMGGELNIKKSCFNIKLLFNLPRSSKFTYH